MITSDHIFWDCFHETTSAFSNRTNALWEKRLWSASCWEYNAIQRRDKVQQQQSCGFWILCFSLAMTIIDQRAEMCAVGFQGGLYHRIATTIPKQSGLSPTFQRVIQITKKGHWRSYLEPTQQKRSKSAILCGYFWHYRWFSFEFGFAKSTGSEDTGYST